MKALIEILRIQLANHHVTDIIQTGERELSLVVDTKENIKQIKKMAELIHEDSEVQIKGIKITFVDQYGSAFESL